MGQVRRNYLIRPKHESGVLKRVTLFIPGVFQTQTSFKLWFDGGGPVYQPRQIQSVCRKPGRIFLPSDRTGSNLDSYRHVGADYTGLPQTVRVAKEPQPV